MGAGGSKSLQSEKARHAAEVISVVRAFMDDVDDQSSPSKSGDESASALVSSSMVEIEGSNHSNTSFRNKIYRAASEAKKHGHNIDESIAKLSEEDIESLGTHRMH
jgi:hypothetical protein